MERMTGIKLFLGLAAGYVLLELLSWIGYNHPAVGFAGFVLVVLATALLSWRNLGWGVVIVLGELFVGSQGGYMLTMGPANVDGAILSLRMGVFLALFGAWSGRVVLSLVEMRVRKAKARETRGLKWYFIMKDHGLLWPYAILLLVFAFGAVRGVLAGNEFSKVFFDANGYAFFALLPAFVQGLSNLRAQRVLWYVFAAAVTVSVGKTLAVLYFFSHRIFEVASNMYVWIRDTRVGEVTVMTADFHRVFFQSHLFVLAGIFTAYLLCSHAKRFRSREFLIPFGLFVLGLVVMLLGMSRSFWFGGLLGLVTVTALMLRSRCCLDLWKRMAVLAPLGLIFAVLIIAAVYAFPYPDRTAEVSFASMMGGRAVSVSGDAAANSRWDLLRSLWPVGFEYPVFGSGLGTEVTYTTSDPRLLADIPNARYTTYSFEWGYHDLWVKFGLLGLGAYAWLIAVILKPYVAHIKVIRARIPGRKNGKLSDERKRHTIIVIGIISGTVAMLATNVFSPYLNHPLGIGMLMAVAALGISASEPVHDEDAV